VDKMLNKMLGQKKKR